VLTETSASAGSILGFDASGSKIRVYYRQYNNGVLESAYYDLTHTTLYYQYNKISSDRTNTSLASLQPGNKILSSGLTDNEVYMQAGVGIVTKVEFPYIKDLYNVNDVLLINSAVLVIEPVHGTYSATRQLPLELTLYHTNETKSRSRRCIVIIPITRSMQRYPLMKNSALQRDTTFQSRSICSRSSLPRMLVSLH
jgi:hypothetical protein